MPPTSTNVDNAGVFSMLDGITLKFANKHIFRTLAENRKRVHLEKSVVAVKIATELNLSNKQEHGPPSIKALLNSKRRPPVSSRTITSISPQGNVIEQHNPPCKSGHPLRLSFSTSYQLGGRVG
jgi:hypothetical protein